MLVLSGAGTTFASHDLHRELYPNSFQDQALAYSNLIIYADPDKGTIQADAAAALPEQPDPKTYIFTLRPDVVFQDKPPVSGRKLTADDVVWNIQRQVARTDLSGKQTNDFYRFSSIYQYVDSVQAVDATHVKVTLKSQYGPWLDAMCQEANALLAKEAADKIDADLNKADASMIIGTGAYVITDYTPGKQVVAQRNPTYFAKKAGQPVQFLDGIRKIYLGTDPNPLRAAVVQKQIDSWGGSGVPFTSDYMQQLQQQMPGSRLANVADPTANQFIIYSVNKPPWNNTQLAQAVNLALDRDQFLQLFYQGEGRPFQYIPWSYAGWALSPEELGKLPGYRPDKTQDLKDARSLWQAGGGPAVGTITLRVIQTAAYSMMLEWLPAMLNKNLGINQFKGEYLPVESVVNHLGSPNFDNITSARTGFVFSDPRGFLAGILSPNGSINFSRYSSDAVTSLVNNMVAELDVDKAQNLSRQIQTQVNSDGGAGNWCTASSIAKYADWGYAHIVRSNIAYPGKLLSRSWIDQKDPSLSGRPKL